MKIWKRFLAGTMGFLLFVGTVLQSQALSAWDMNWPSLTLSVGSYKYGTFDYVQTSSGKTLEKINGNNQAVIFLSFEEGTSDFTVVPTSFLTSMGKETIVTPCDTEVDLFSPARFEMYAEDGRHYPFFMIGQADREFTEDDLDARVALAGRLEEEVQRWWAKINEIEEIANQKKIEVGGYHPAHYAMLYEIGRGLWGDVAGVIAYRDKNVNATAADFEEEIRTNLAKTNEKTLRAETIEKVLDTVIPYYLDYVETHRIASPDILSYSIGNSKGVVDQENKTVTIRMPEGTDWYAIDAPVIITPEGVKTKLTMGSLASGEAVYVLTPWEETTGVTYDGVDSEQENGYGCGVNLSSQWIVTVEEGTPYNVISSFAVRMHDGTVRYAEIDEQEHTITLNLPVGTDLTSVEAEIVHTGQSLLLDGSEWQETTVDFTNVRTLTVVNDAYGLRQDYQVTITAEKSSANDMLSYSIGDREAVINGDQVTITVPYGTDLSAVVPDIEISEFATLSKKPDTLTFDSTLTYTVQAENGYEKNYYVTITEEAVSTQAEIKSFRYGGSIGEIDAINGTITLQVPENTDITKLAPVIEISEYASISPASGETVDFTNPVTYTVTSQSGTNRRSYVVTVKKVAAGENPYKAQMSTLVGKIVQKYIDTNTSQSDDWTWMNVGFYQNIQRETVEELPANFDMAGRIAQLDTNSSTAMTTIARVNMMLTALGVNTTNLDAYSDGEGFVDSHGNVVHDLAACIYNYSGTYTINGPAFALISLDMGNYTIPENANWTRERLLDVLLAHEYGTDGFGIDMVGAIMYAIAPYQNDAVYGERVRAKLDEGLAIILGEKSAPGVNPMLDDFMFYSTGTINSEAAGWVIMALCSMGIDPQTDPRFIDGNGTTVISQYMTYADEDSFAHTATVRDNALATYEACYTMQWYLSFLENGGAGHPRYYWYHRFDFSRQLSSDARIDRFVLDGQEGVIDEENKTIQVMVPSGMDLSDVTPELTLSGGATLKAPNLPVTFVEDVSQPFTILAEDGTTMVSYQVTVSVDENLLGKGTDIVLSSITLQNAAILKDVEILERSMTENIDSTDIVLKVGAEVDLTNLYMKGNLSYGATADPDILSGTTKLDLSGWNLVTVTSEDESASRIYRIKAVKKAVAGIQAFYLTIDGVTYEGAIDDNENTIRITGVPSTADVKSLAPEIILTEGTDVCSPLTGVPQNFTVPVSYTVSGNNMDAKTYTVHVTDAEGNYITGEGNTDPGTDPGTSITDAKMTGFTVCGAEGVINHSAGTVLVTLPAGTDVSAVAPTVKVESGCTVSPVSGEVVDLRSPIVYSVTNGNVTSNYTIIILFEQSISQQLWDKLEDNNTISDHQVVKD